MPRKAPPPVIPPQRRHSRERGNLEPGVQPNNIPPPPPHSGESRNPSGNPLPLVGEGQKGGRLRDMVALETLGPFAIEFAASTPKPSAKTVVKAHSSFHVVYDRIEMLDSVFRLK